jgi:hypothetical protein
MTRWFRYYDDALDDPKVQRLSGDLFKVWVNLLSLASKNDGKLPSTDDIAFRLRISIQDAQQRVEDLILAGLIDVLPDKSFEPHNWSERQFASDSSAVRMQKLRKKKQSKNNGDVTSDVTVTVQTQTRGDTDTNNKLQLSNLEARREVKSELGFNLNSKLGLGSRDGMETLLRQAEGFGLDVDELVEITNRNRPKKREGYFSTLCVNRLKDQLPGLDEQIIRDALNGKHEQSKTVCALLVGAIP